MALVRRCKSLNLKRSCDDLEMGFVGCTRGFGRKRVAIANSPKTPAKSFFDLDSEKSLLESLPQELLIRVLCGVDHEDLGKLVVVSKTIKEAALIARKWHFAYSTPKSKTKGMFRTEMDSEASLMEEEVDARVRNAPIRNRFRQKNLNPENIGILAVRLFD